MPAHRRVVGVTGQYFCMALISHRKAIAAPSHRAPATRARIASLPVLFIRYPRRISNSYWIQFLRYWTYRSLRSHDIPVHTAYLVVTWIAVTLITFSAIATITHNKRILATFDAVNVPRSWLVFPLGTLKLAGALGLILGLATIHGIGTAAAFGLVLYFTCALYTHVFAHDYSVEHLAGAGMFLLLSSATLWLNIADLHPTWH